MKIGRLGTLIGVAVQLVAGAAIVLWPNPPWIPWTVLAGGVVLMAISVWRWLSENYELQSPIVRRTSKRPSEEGAVPKSVTDDDVVLEHLYLGGVEFDVGASGIHGTLNRNLDAALVLVFKNSSNKLIFMKQRSVHYSLGGRSPMLEKKLSTSDVVAIYPGAEMRLKLELIKDIPINNGRIIGVLNFEILYGCSRDNPKYLWIFEAIPILSFLPPIDDQREVKINTMIGQRRSEHKKVSGDWAI